MKTEFANFKKYIEVQKTKQINTIKRNINNTENFHI